MPAPSQPATAGVTLGNPAASSSAPTGFTLGGFASQTTAATQQTTGGFNFGMAKVQATAAAPVQPTPALSLGAQTTGEFVLLGL